MPEPEEGSEEALPRWVLNTPVRSYEWWSVPVLLVLVAAALVWTVVSFDVWPVVRVGGVVGAVIVAASAVVLARYARAAFVEQEMGASWRFHVVQLYVGVAVFIVIAVFTMVVGWSGFVAGALTVSAGIRRAVVEPRPHELTLIAAAMWFVGLVAALFLVLGLVLPGVPTAQSSGWVGSGFVLIPLTAVLGFLELRAARRAEASANVQ